MGADLRGVFDRAANTYDVAGARLFTEMALHTAPLRGFAATIPG